MAEKLVAAGEDAFNLRADSCPTQGADLYTPHYENGKFKTWMLAEFDNVPLLSGNDK